MKNRSSLLLILAWMMGLIGLACGLLLEPLWFARFGSMVVLFGVMSEYVLMHSEFNLLYQRLDKLNVGQDIPDLSPSKWYRKKVWLSHLTVIGGTLIWGFGDLLV